MNPILSRVAFALVACLLGATCAYAQKFPERPVRLVIPFSPGGPVDATFRALAEPAGKILGQPVVIENRAGATATLGPASIVNAAPDGHTLAVMAITVFRLPHMSKTSWDPLKDFTYVVRVAGLTLGVAVPSEAPYKTWKELVEWARANPGKLSYGSNGVGGSIHLVMEQLALIDDVKFFHVPYKGSAESIQGVLGGHTLAAPDTTAWAPHVASGRLRLLATWGENRTRKWPAVPTLKELGYPVVGNSPFGIAGPRGMDPRVVRVLHDAFRKAMDDPGFAAVMERYDQETAYLDSAAYEKYARETYAEERKLLGQLDLLAK